MSDHVLAHPRTDRGYTLWCDSSKDSIGSVLCQDDDDGNPRPIHYISKRLSKLQTHWPIVVKESFAIVYSLRKLHTYVHGSPLTIMTDAKDLLASMTGNHKNPKLKRYQYEIASYDPVIQYVEGHKNTVADYLSRIYSEDEISVEELREVDPSITKETQPIRVRINAVSVTTDDLLCNDQIPWVTDGLDRAELIELQRQMPQYEQALLDADEYTLVGDVMYSLRTPYQQPARPRLVLPPKYRDHCIRRAHLDSGHSGFLKTHHNLLKSYVWPGMKSDVLKVLRRCAPCILNNTRSKRPLPSRMPVPTAPHLLWACDLVGQLPMSKKGHRYLLTVIDHCTGWIEAIPLKSKAAIEIVNAFHYHLFPRFGICRNLLSDLGGEFCNGMFTDYLKNMGCTHIRTTSYHPQTNGKLEVSHRYIKSMITKAVSSSSPHDWEEKLGSVLWAYRTTVSSVTGFTPYYLLHGYHPGVPREEIISTPTDPNIKLVDRVLEHKEALRLAVDRTIKAHEIDHARKTTQARPQQFKVGDRIAIRAETRTTFQPRWDHGYLCTRVEGSVLWLLHESTGRECKVNAARAIIVPPDADLEDCVKRMTRTQRLKAEQEVRDSLVPQKGHRHRPTLPPIAEELQEAPEEARAMERWHIQQTADQLVDDTNVHTMPVAPPSRPESRMDDDNQTIDSRRSSISIDPPDPPRRSARIAKQPPIDYEDRTDSDSDSTVFGSPPTQSREQSPSPRLSREPSPAPAPFPRRDQSPSPPRSRSPIRNESRAEPEPEPTPQPREQSPSPPRSRSPVHTRQLKDERNRPVVLNEPANLTDSTVTRYKAFNPVPGGSSTHDVEQVLPSPQEASDSLKPTAKRSKDASTSEDHRVQPKFIKDSVGDAVPKNKRGKNMVKYPPDPPRRSARLATKQSDNTPGFHFKIAANRPSTIPDLRFIKVQFNPRWNLNRCVSCVA